MSQVARSGMSFAPSLALSWWLGFRIGFDGWSKSCRLSGRNLHRARRDKIPGDLSGQELASLRSMPISRSFEPEVELAMNVSQMNVLNVRTPAMTAGRGWN